MVKCINCICITIQVHSVMAVQYFHRRLVHGAGRQVCEGSPRFRLLNVQAAPLCLHSHQSPMIIPYALIKIQKRNDRKGKQ